MLTLSVKSENELFDREGRKGAFATRNWLKWNIHRLFHREVNGEVSGLNDSPNSCRFKAGRSAVRFSIFFKSGFSHLSISSIHKL